MSSKITLPELKDLCKENSIKGFSKLKKNEIIDLLKKNNIDIVPQKNREETEVVKKSDIKETEKSTSDNEIPKKVNKKETTKDKEEKELDEIMKNPIVKYYVYEDEKSNKFWEITYDNIKEEKIKYIVRYGKTDTPGSRSKPKKDTLKNIEKLIETKIKKGYKI